MTDSSFFLKNTILFFLCYIRHYQFHLPSRSISTSRSFTNHELQPRPPVHRDRKNYPTSSLRQRNPIHIREEEARFLFRRRSRRRHPQRHRRHHQRIRLLRRRLQETPQENRPLPLAAHVVLLRRPTNRQDLPRHSGDFRTQERHQFGWAAVFLAHDDFLPSLHDWGVPFELPLAAVVTG
jgi:hypothetical protein